MAFSVCAMLGALGCGSGEFRAEEVPSKAEIQKDIDRIKASTSIPEPAKVGIIKGLEKKMERAK